MKLRTSLAMPTLLAAQSKSKYVGANACKPSHLIPKSGAAYNVWQESKDAKAFAILAISAAKEIQQRLFALGGKISGFPIGASWLRRNK